jgi:PAS domain S-box-containing protein
MVDLERQLTGLKHGDHICPIYENEAEQMAVAIPFLKKGLARGERCLYVADDRSAEQIAQALKAAGVDVSHEQARGALLILTKRETYLKAGDEFDPQAMIEFLHLAEVQALAEGFSGLRVLGETAWALGPKVTSHRLIEYEALVNEFLKNSRSLCLCQYNRQRYDPAIIHDVLRTHPIAILGDQVCPNPYYEPPELMLSPEPQASAEFKAKRVGWWIDQLKRARTDEQERDRARENLKQSERRLAEAQQVAHIGSWERDLRTNKVTWPDELYRLFGLQGRDGDLTYQQFLKLVLPEDVDRIRGLVDAAIREHRGFKCDYRIPLADGSVHVMNDQGNVILNEAGEAVRLVGTAQDVTQLRQAEQTLQAYTSRLQALSRRLLEVQEAERRHLARELHDEIAQLLTGLGLLMKPEVEVSPEAARATFEQMQAIIDELLERIRGLSFDLRPAELDELGLVPALLALFERYTGQTGIQVNFKQQGMARRFQSEVETAAYRTVQEALTNVARHARAVDATVQIRATSEVLSVQIEDRGRGFDSKTTLRAPQSGGLMGMQERLLLLGGNLTVESRPGGGTRIIAEFPLHSG